MPLPHSIHLLQNHVSDCMRRARSTAGSSRDARSPLCATGVNEPVVTTVPCCWTLELTAAASAACGPGLVLPICKCVGHFRCSQVPRESRFCQTSRVPCLGPLDNAVSSPCPAEPSSWPCCCYAVFVFCYHFAINYAVYAISSLDTGSPLRLTHGRRDTPGSCRARSPALHVGGRDRVASWSWSCFAVYAVCGCFAAGANTARRARDDHRVRPGCC